MAESFKGSTPDISTLSDGQIIKIGSNKGIFVFGSMFGVGFVAETSTWQWVESADGVNWNVISFTTKVIANGDNLMTTSTHIGLFLGLQMLTKSTESAGIINYNIGVKQ